MRLEPTPELVVGLWEHLSAEFDSTVVSKDDSDLMEAVGWMLDTIGVMDKENFLANYGTTLGDTIYIPFVVGETGGRWGLDAQMSMALHEHEHVWQAAREGFLTFAASYLTKKSGRAYWEAEAYRTNMEFWHWLTGNVPSAQYYAEKIVNYGCGKPEVAYIQAYLEMSKPVIRAGELISPVMKSAAKYLGPLCTS